MGPPPPELVTYAALYDQVRTGSSWLSSSEGAGAGAGTGTGTGTAVGASRRRLNPAYEVLLATTSSVYSLRSCAKPGRGLGRRNEDVSSPLVELYCPASSVMLVLRTNQSENRWQFAIWRIKVTRGLVRRHFEDGLRKGCVQESDIPTTVDSKPCSSCTKIPA